MRRDTLYTYTYIRGEEEEEEVEEKVARYGTDKGENEVRRGGSFCLEGK